MDRAEATRALAALDREEAAASPEMRQAYATYFKATRIILTREANRAQVVRPADLAADIKSLPPRLCREVVATLAARYLAPPKKPPPRAAVPRFF